MQIIRIKRGQDFTRPLLYLNEEGIPGQPQGTTAAVYFTKTYSEPALTGGVSPLTQEPGELADRLSGVVASHHDMFNGSDQLYVMINDPKSNPELWHPVVDAMQVDSPIDS